MIKPNAVKAGATDAIIDAAKAAGFVVKMQEHATLSREQAETFYGEHKGKGFFGKLVNFMTSGPIVKLVLERENAIAAWRALLGPTNSLTAKTDSPSSVRALYGKDGTENAAHGSDSPDSAAREIDIMFPEQSTMVVMQAFADDEAGAGIALAQQIFRAQKFAVSAKRTSLSEDEAGIIGGGCPSGKVLAMVLTRSGAVAALSALSAYFSKYVQTAYVSADAATAAAAIEAVFPVQQTVAVIKPDAVGSKAAIIAELEEAGYTVMKQEDETLSETKAAVLYAEHKTEGFFDDVKAHMSSGPCTKLLLQSRGAVACFRELIGPTDPEAAKEADPGCLRAKYGTDTGANAVHGSKNAAAASRECDVLFATEIAPEEAKLPVQQTYAMIKPNAVTSADEICLLIENHGFTIVKQELTEEPLPAETVAAFYSEHEGKEFFEPLTTFMCSGPVVKLVLERPNAIKAWRAMCGPTNPAKAAVEAPSSIRARFGNMENGTENACHGSDSTASAEREIALMFPPQVEAEPEAEAEE